MSWQASPPAMALAAPAAPASSSPASTQLRTDINNLLEISRELITSPVSRVPSKESLHGAVFAEPHLSGDIHALLQQQQDAIRRTLALNEAIQLWTDAHPTAQIPAISTPGEPFSEIPGQSPAHSAGNPGKLFSGSQLATLDSSPASSPCNASTPLLSDAGQVCTQKRNPEIVSTPVGSTAHCLVRTKTIHELLFPDYDKATVAARDYLNRPVETIEDLYTKTGPFQAVAKNRHFNNISLVVILMNTIWIAVDTDYNHAEILCNALPIFQIVDNFFCVFFSFEICVRLMAFKRKVRALSDKSFVFDIILVSFMVWETWIQVLLFKFMGAHSFGGAGKVATIFRIFRLARLTRVARAGKLLRSVPELLILAKATFLALRSVMAILVMLTLVLYVFAILFTQLLNGCEVAKGRFNNVPQAMNFLLIQLLCGFDSDFMYDLVAAGLTHYFMFLLFLLIASMTIMNMLIGILCDVVSSVSADEKEDSFEKDIETHLAALISKDDNEDRMVTKDQFLHIMRDHDLIDALDGTGMDVVAFLEYATFVFKDNGTLKADDFMHLITQFRGDRVATVKDLVNTRKYITHVLESMTIHLPGHK